MRERLQKALAAAGMSSRRNAEVMIEAGDVRVNGQIARIGQLVDREKDRIEVLGQTVEFSTPPVYLALNKPAGYVTSLRSTHGERIVVDLVDLASRVVPVGRLDRDTSGLLLLTNDGDWANIVAHPRFGVEKTYEVVVRGRLTPADLEALRFGITLPDGYRTTRAGVVSPCREGPNTRLSVTVIEGKKRQIRLMFDALGHPVLTLCRVRVGPIELGSLKSGSWRRLNEAEVEGVRTYGRRATTGGGPPRAPADCD
jgi:23S rRNA pseudouridine2605 synthase